MNEAEMRRTLGINRPRQSEAEASTGSSGCLEAIFERRGGYPFVRETLRMRAIPKTAARDDHARDLDPESLSASLGGRVTFFEFLI
jgi:hypothetical protein